MAALICASVILPWLAGILPLPLVTAAIKAASDAPTMDASLNEAAFKAFPAGVAPAPSAPWHIWHLPLYTSAPPFCANAGVIIADAIDKTATRMRSDFMRKLLWAGSLK